MHAEHLLYLSSCLLPLDGLNGDPGLQTGQMALLYSCPGRRLPTIFFDESDFS
jgi:hypothetical protein